ncbi:unnamed protein product, partial [Amoebophrya sp. A120]
ILASDNVYRESWLVRNMLDTLQELETKKVTLTHTRFMVDEAGEMLMEQDPATFLEGTTEAGEDEQEDGLARDRQLLRTVRVPLALGSDILLHCAKRSWQLWDRALNGDEEERRRIAAQIDLRGEENASEILDPEGDDMVCSNEFFEFSSLHHQIQVYPRARQFLEKIAQLVFE